MRTTVEGKFEWIEKERLWITMECTAVEIIHIIVFHADGSLTSNEVAGVGGRRDGQTMGMRSSSVPNAIVAPPRYRDTE